MCQPRLCEAGLHEILFSKITKRQRDPAMQLVASVIEVFFPQRSTTTIPKINNNNKDFTNKIKKYHLEKRSLSIFLFIRTPSSI